MCKLCMYMIAVGFVHAIAGCGTHHPAVAVAHPSSTKSIVTTDSTVRTACPNVSLNLWWWRGSSSGGRGAWARCMGKVHHAWERMAHAWGRMDMDLRDTVRHRR
jgi:hypothetical protein